MVIYGNMVSYCYHKICLHFSNALVWSHKRAVLLLSGLSYGSGLAEILV